MTPDKPLALYNSARAGMSAVMRRAMESGDVPEVVVETILRAATAASPKRRYTAGKMARHVSLMRRFVPAAAFDKGVRKQNGLPS